MAYQTESKDLKPGCSSMLLGVTLGKGVGFKSLSFECKQIWAATLDLLFSKTG